MAKTMKIHATKVMAKAIAKAMQEKGMKFEECRLTSFSERGYEMNVGDIYDAYDHGDYDYTTGEYKVIQICWPWDYYAPATYLSTAELNRIFRDSHATTLDEYMNAVCDRIAV